jgi:hypothetical protein
MLIYFVSVTTGGLWSATRKRRVQEALEQERAFQEEYERRKKYTGPVGKNPWGTIAQDWTKLNKGGPMDFAAELELFKGLRGIGGGAGGQPDLRRKFGGMNRRLEPPVKKDWDAPENFEEKIVVEVPVRGLKRMRSNVESDVELSDVESDADRNDDEVQWSKKLKRPRMTMVADEVETR